MIQMTQYFNWILKNLMKYKQMFNKLINNKQK